MYAVGRLGSFISRGVYSVSGPFHPFGGAVDIIVVEQPDGSFKSSPWYVKFGKFQGVLKTKEKVVNIGVNGVEANFHMYLDHKGEAYFLREADGEEGESLFYPSSSGDEKDEHSQSNSKPPKSQSLNFDSTKPNLVNQIDATNGKNLNVPNSGHSRILGLVFGGRSLNEKRLQEGEGGAGIKRTSSLECAEIAADLLEVKWSTDLATKSPGKGKASRTLPYQALDSKADEDVKINDEQTTVNSFEHSKMENSLEDCTLQKEMEIPCVSTVEQVGECSTIVQSVLGEKCGAISEISSNSGHDEYVKDVISEVGDTTSQLPHSNEPVAYPAKQFAEQVYDERDVMSRSWGISQGGVGTAPYSETLKSSEVGLDDSSECTLEFLHPAGEGHRKVRFDSKTLPEKADITSKDTGTEQIAVDIEFKAELVEVPENQSHQINPSHSCTDESEKVDHGKPLTVPESYTQMVTVDPILTSSHEVQDEKCIEDENITAELQFALESISDSQKSFIDDEPLSIPPSESLEEQQFLFSGEDQAIKPVPQGHIDEGKDPSTIFNTIEVVNSFPSTDSKIMIEKLRVMSNPISIIRSHRIVDEDVGRKVESLPNMQWSHIDSLDLHDLPRPLSHSLDSNAKSLNWTVLCKDDSSCVKSEANKEDQSIQEQANIEDRLLSVELKNALCNPAVELSLCKHLLNERMGADAASQAFEAEKLDMEKFCSLFPAVVKDDRLVVRIGNCYLPWDAAEPIILELVSCESGLIFEPKGTIAVDRVENPQGDPSKTIISSSGGWTLWPFSFRRSKSREALQPTSDDARISPAENVLERNISLNENRKVIGSKGVRKMLRSMIPTSEQLASLKLMEGRNMVTFTFSTAMLGKQEVDARIYLWKWNTRIVISDVDGTITKSDLLGQFMPLVGRDWSQTGVAHLFSAIKENGYQLLFLSARAIAQAYHTRQFLLNLKQDGKALPDGPVVISPDGLFPSLFREVIRRAPHEFKITCLEDIKALFPSDCNPFYAGFGNRDTDEISYLKVGIPKGKIFTINPRGEIAVNRRLDTKSYTSLHALVHGMFPPMASSEQEDFNSWNFWKLPPLILDI